MALRWTRQANADLLRVYEFLAPVNPPAAVRAARHIVAGARRLMEAPRIGQLLPGFGEREVRRITIGRYELRYEIRGTDLFVLRLFHMREDR
jgi:plasmid stabilization system protein ParE